MSDNPPSQPLQGYDFKPIPAAPNTAPAPNVVDQAVQQYPVLQSLNPIGLMSTDTPDQYNSMLEHWGPNDMGEPTRPRPQQFPPGRVGIQVFNPSTTPDDVAGDIVSHTLVNTDPKISGTYQQFKSSLTPSQKKFLKGDYDEETKAASKNNVSGPGTFDEWLDRVGAPAALRGYVFNQYSPSDQQEFGYSKQQKQFLDNIKQYVTSKR